MSSIFLANSSGNVLINGAGNSFKQNYVFGNCIGNPSGNCTNYVQVAVPNLTAATINYFYKNLSNNEGGSVLLTFSDGKSCKFALFNPSVSFYQNDSASAMANGYYVSATGTTAGVNLFTFTIASGVLTFYLNGVLKGSASLLSNGILSSVQFGPASRSSSGSGYGANNFITYPSIFSRLLSPAEMVYLYNNKSGNNFQSILGLFSKPVINQAQVLDFSAAQNGSDMRVGFVDGSGQFNHGQILNLIAGSQAAQAANINSNFISVF